MSLSKGMADDKTSTTPTTTTAAPPDVKALEGTRAADDKVTIEAAILAYESIDSAAGNIAKVVQSKAAGSPVVLQSDKDVGAAFAFRAFRAHVTNLTSALANIAAPAVVTKFVAAALPAAIGGVTTAVKAVIELLALFRTNVDVKGVAITSDETALIAEVTGRLANLGVKAFVPAIQPFPSDGSIVQSVLAGLLLADHEAAARVGNDASAKADYDALHAVVLALTAELSKPAADGSTPMTTLIRGEGFAEFADAKKPVTLFLKLIQAGGGNRLRQSLLPAKGIEYSGGAIVDYILFGHDGAVLAGATLEGYSGGVKDLSERVPA